MGHTRGGTDTRRVHTYETEWTYTLNGIHTEDYTHGGTYTWKDILENGSSGFVRPMVCSSG